MSRELRTMQILMNGVISPANAPSFHVVVRLETTVHLFNGELILLKAVVTCLLPTAWSPDATAQWGIRSAFVGGGGGQGVTEAQDGRGLTGLWQLWGHGFGTCPGLEDK